MMEGIRSGLLAIGLYAAGRTPSRDLLGLIKKLRPQDCGKGLVRIGGQGDGGYLIPDDFEGIEYCFSPGVNTVSDFENDLAEKGIRSFMADYSVDGPPIARPEFTFDKKFLGSADRGHFMTLASWKDKYIPDYAGDLILQMDIEGAEYEVLFSLPDRLLNQFRIMAIEFHNLDRLFDPVVFSIFSSCFDKILQYFHVAHIHPNNCCGSCKVEGIEIPRAMEFTFINKRRVGSAEPRVRFPHQFDVDNTSAASLPLPSCWYSPGEFS
ncbi:MAG TPA: hypothetical protein VHX37_17270 [Acidobacteriaceae bacterium]|jgi:hypothetical protein|nr:hypothetical protein [Acidobacteriaceae bacterium]